MTISGAIATADRHASAVGVSVGTVNAERVTTAGSSAARSRSSGS